MQRIKATQERTRLLKTLGRAITTKKPRGEKIGIIDDQPYMIEPLETLLKIWGYEPIFWKFDSKTRRDKIIIPQCIYDTCTILVDHDIGSGCSCGHDIFHTCPMPTGGDIVSTLRKTGYQGPIGSISMQVPEYLREYEEKLPQFPGKLALYYVPNQTLVEEFYTFLTLVSATKEYAC
jgi:hypothetical protein